MDDNVDGINVTNKTNTQARVIQPIASVRPATTNANPESQSISEGSPSMFTVPAQGDSFIRSSMTWHVPGTFRGHNTN